MEANTERQMVLWNAWYREELDNPGKPEFYAMQVAAEVRCLREQVACLFGGRGKEVKLMDFKIPFAPRKAVDKGLLTTMAKQVWASVVESPEKCEEGRGLEIEHRTITRTEARARGLYPVT